MYPLPHPRLHHVQIFLATDPSGGPWGLKDWIDFFGVLATIGAAAMAAYAIIQTNKQARANELALIRERKSEMYLGLLVEVADVLKGIGGIQTDKLRVRALLLPVSLVPLLRASQGIESTDQAKEWYARELEQLKTQPSGTSLYGQIEPRVSKEVEEAIQSILDGTANFAGGAAATSASAAKDGA